MGTPNLLKFLAKVVKTSSCWEWRGSLSTNGYGRFMSKRTGKWSPAYAHVVSYELFKGPVTKGLDVMHSCDNRKCVNPEHLSLGTRSQNLQDAVSKGRMAGESVSTAKLTLAEVLEVKASKEKGVILAKRFGVCAATISSIRTGRSWVHANS
jgi:hypothetical protein